MTLAAASRILDLVQKQFEGGTASQLEDSQQAALVATVRASIPPLIVTIEQNVAALALLTGHALALVALEQTTIQEREQAEAVSSSRRAFEISETQLRAGTVTLINVLQTRQTLFTNENVLVQVRLSRPRDRQPVSAARRRLGPGADRCSAP